MNRLISSAVAGFALLTCSALPSSAAFIHDFGVLGGNGSVNYGASVGATPFSDYYTFTVGSLADVTISVTNNFTKNNTGQSIPDLHLSLYSGTYGSGMLLDDVGTTASSHNSNDGGFIDTISTGSYYIQVSSVSGPQSNAAYGGVFSYSVSAVPLPSSLPLFSGALLAFAGFGYALNRWVSPKNLGTV